MKDQNINLFAAVIVVIGFVFFWDAFIVSKYAPSKKQSKSAQTLQNKDVQMAPPVQFQSKREEASKKAGVTQDPPLLMKVLENDRNRVTFEIKGARVVSWQLRERDHWIDLVATHNTSGQFPLQTFSDVNFKVESIGEKNIAFSGVLPNGVKVIKTLLLSGDSYTHQLFFSFENPTPSEVTVDGNIDWPEGLFKKVEGGPANSKAEGRARAEIRVLGMTDRVKSWKPGAFFGKTKDEIVAGPFKWAGVDNEHFLAALIPVDGVLPSIRVSFSKETPPAVSMPIFEKIGPNQTKRVDFKLFVGPKKMGVLEQANFNLKDAVDYGFLEKILLAALQFVHRFTNNYGWAIIFLTIFIQILMFPLTKKSLQSSLKMKAIQPQIKKIQALYKGDTQRLHIETMNLYKKHGMKFMGMEGCLPLIIQMPIFFAIFKMLRSAYDLRGAPWIFWIKDLSAADPFYVLPIIMGLGMFVQQKTTTVSVDPAQAKMMYIFPVVLTFMFSSMPAGLVIYWVVQSAATIVIQKLLTMKLQVHPQVK